MLGPVHSSISVVRVVGGEPPLQSISLSLFPCSHLVDVPGLLVVWSKLQDVLEVREGLLDVVLVVQAEPSHKDGIRATRNKKKKKSMN